MQKKYYNYSHKILLMATVQYFHHADSKIAMEGYMAYQPPINKKKLTHMGKIQEKYSSYSRKTPWIANLVYHCDTFGQWSKFSD